MNQYYPGNYLPQGGAYPPLPPGSSHHHHHHHHPYMQHTGGMHNSMSIPLDVPTDRCTFFSKMGACRHGDHCTKIHNRPTASPTVVFPMMYPNPLAVRYLTGEYTGPKEFEKKYIKKHFEHFYKETWRSLMEIGKIEELRVVSNLGEHLLGSVYVRFDSNDAAAKVVKQLKNKKFNKIILLPELSPVTNFSEACCKEDCEGHCGRGAQCNYLHIMKVSRKLLEKLEHEQAKFWKRREKSMKSVKNNTTSSFSSGNHQHHNAMTPTGGESASNGTGSRSPSEGGSAESGVCELCGKAGHSGRICPMK